MKFTQLTIIFIFLLAFVVSVSAQDNPYPNELEGFEFFGKEKLQELQLTVSSKEDVEKIFGSQCKNHCELNSDWLIRFEYFEDIWISTSRNDKDEKMTYFLDSKYVGKLRLIEIRPKNQISFADICFPKEFQELLLTSTGSKFDSEKSLIMGDKAFRDSNGLTYEIVNKTISYNTKNKDTITFNKGELVLIRYDIPKELKNNLFILQK